MVRDGAVDRRARATRAVGAALLFGLLARAACAADTLVVSGLDELGNPALAQTIRAYYAAEKAGDWQTTYALRGAAFARIVPFDTYLRQMALDAHGWQLVAIEGRSVGGDGQVVNLTLAFREDVAPAVAARLLGPEFASPATNDRPRRYAQPEVTQWVERDGQWLALAPGARQHFVFNERLVWDEPQPRAAQAAAR